MCDCVGFLSHMYTGAEVMTNQAHIVLAVSNLQLSVGISEVVSQPIENSVTLYT